MLYSLYVVLKKNGSMQNLQASKQVPQTPGVQDGDNEVHHTRHPENIYKSVEYLLAYLYQMSTPETPQIQGWERSNSRFEALPFGVTSALCVYSKRLLI